MSMTNKKESNWLEYFLIALFFCFCIPPNLFRNYIFYARGMHQGLYQNQTINPEISSKMYCFIHLATSLCLSSDLAERQVTLKDINSQRNNNKVFTFDNVFEQQTSQIEMFDSTSYALTKEVLEGYNGTVFAYGQTGSGKTYTMMGDSKNEEEKGLIPRCFQSILSTAQTDKTKDYLVMCSYVELYNEEIRDLLHFNEKTKLELR